MTQHSPTTLEELNAFVDNELDSDERADLIKDIGRHEMIARQLAELYQLKNLVALSYRDPPLPSDRGPNVVRRPLAVRALAASLLLSLGISGGWVAQQNLAAHDAPRFSELAHSDARGELAATDKLVMHINALDDQRVQRVLDTAEQLLRKRHAEHRPMQIEVIANESGLGVLRADSPYAGRIAQLYSAHDGNISFKACGIAMAIAREDEGREVQLLPEAKPVDAALEQILRRLKSGWSYAKG